MEFVDRLVRFCFTAFVGAGVGAGLHLLGIEPLYYWVALAFYLAGIVSAIYWAWGWADREAIAQTVEAKPAVEPEPEPAAADPTGEAIVAFLIKPIRPETVYYRVRLSSGDYIKSIDAPSMSVELCRDEAEAGRWSQAWEAVTAAGYCHARSGREVQTIVEEVCEARVRSN